jgi:hypothetical protein
MSAPERIQLRRTPGWRKPSNTVVVARPSRWGNPARFAQHTRGRWLVTAPWLGEPIEAHDKSAARRASVETFRSHLGSRRSNVPDPTGYPSDAEIHSALAGRHLACWCPLHEPCHADVLLEVANLDNER